MADSTNKLANNKYREYIMSKVRDLLTELGEDVQQTASNTFMFPFVNELRADECLKIVFSIPTGSDGNPPDFYEQAQDYAKKVIKDEEKRVAVQAKKAKDIERDEKKRAIAKKGEI